MPTENKDARAIMSNAQKEEFKQDIVEHGEEAEDAVG